jgi:tetratricopeptide (TPR) repeat protein
MRVPFSRRCLVIVTALVLSWHTSLAQKPGSGKGGPPNNPVPPIPGTDLATARPVYVSGNVILEGSGPPPARIVIQRICNGQTRREGYTDAKGQFQFQLSSEFEQDSSENDSAGGNPQQTRSSGRASQSRYDGCELRAVLPGFQSTSVALRLLGDDFGEVRVGTIVLTRLGNAEGSTVSLVSLAAPKNAQRAYEKGRKAEGEKKFEEAEKELNQAVQIYPKYSSAWYLLGEIHRTQKQADQAIKEYSQSIATDPLFVSPYFGLAMIAIDQKRWQDAQRLTDQLTKLNPSAYPLAYFYNSAANYNLGQIDAAEQGARKFQSMDPGHSRPEVSLLLASILEAKQDYGGAAHQLRDYLALVPASPLAGQIKADAERLESLGSARPK